MAKSRRIRVLSAALLFVLVGATAAAAGGLTLHPSGFGKQSYAAWKAQEGLPDSSGNAQQALYLQKGDADAFAGALAFIRGFEGRPVSDLTAPTSELSWAHRDDGRCDTSPFWGVRIIGASGSNYSIRLSCAGAVHTPESATPPGWTRDSYAGAGIAAAIQAQGGADALQGTVADLAIVFLDGEGSVYLDNIRVNDQMWTSASDNGN
jgi:hypothetical protein